MISFISVLQYGSLSTLYRIIVLAILIVMTIVEIIRLYLGYLGNLTEKVIREEVVVVFINGLELCQVHRH